MKNSLTYSKYRNCKFQLLSLFINKPKAKSQRRLSKTLHISRSLRPLHFFGQAQFHASAQSLSATWEVFCAYTFYENSQVFKSFATQILRVTNNPVFILIDEKSLCKKYQIYLYTVSTQNAVVFYIYTLLTDLQS